MGVVYDELFISTMKEINVCKKAIRKLSRTLAGMETKYGLTTAEFIENFNDGRTVEEKDHVKWRDSFTGLKNWQQRIKELEQILRDGTKGE